MLGPAATLLAVAAYGALHSLLASFMAKRRARRAFGPASDRLYRLLYNLVAAVSLLPVLAVPAVAPGRLLYRVPMPWIVLTGLAQLLAAGLLLIGLLETDVWHFLGLRQLLEPAADRPAQLVVTGLYRWVRHPLYSAGLVILWLVPAMTTSLLALNLGLTVYILIGSHLEERRLLAEFGEAYLDYRSRTPGLLPFPRPATPAA